ncbi:MAG: hypothetical protein ACQ9MH_24195 [Nitrospinales bacterium]
MKILISLFKGFYSAFAIFCMLAVLFFIVFNHTEYFSGSDSQTKTTAEVSKNQRLNDASHTISSKKLPEKKTLPSGKERKTPDMLIKETSDQPLTSEEHPKTERIVEGVGLSEKELRTLHANQRREIEQMYRNMDSIVIAPGEEGGKGITLGELLALHEQQKQAIKDANDDYDEIVIPALKEGYPDLTRMDLIELHEQQRLAIENVQDWDQVVISDSEDGYPALSWDEVATLQEQQTDEMWERAADPYDLAVPFAEGGGPNMTVREIKNLHMQQLVN